MCYDTINNTSKFFLLLYRAFDNIKTLFTNKCTLLLNT
jgi:hypothetical protein